MAETKANPPQIAGDSTPCGRPTNTKSAGLVAVVLMTLGIQFSGMTSGWNGAAKDGLGNIILANTIIGIMYLLLSMCFAELTSVVAFAGGSFGYCRAALGPFWGFLVGASEMLENFLYVVVTVMTIGSACTEVFGTSRQWEPVWYLLTYGLLVGVHLRGGELLWYTVMVCGIIAVALILLFCVSETPTINVGTYGLQDGRLFSNGAMGFMEAIYFPTTFYIGLEILPQTCDRVKNESITLPRGMILGTLISFLISFWLVIAASCTAPGLTPEFAAQLFPLQHGYGRSLHMARRLCAFVSLLPLLSSGIGFMWGCGYQVMALARSGLMPTLCTKTFGTNETPYVNLCVSALLQYVVCVWMWAMAPTEGPHVLYETVVIGASMVYMGVFGSFIVFRYRFGAMKREWVSAAGVPGALVGMFIAMLLFMSAVGFQEFQYAMAIYFVFMTLAGVYYLWYAQRTQYFSAEEQKKFMKAYILNANKKSHRKAKLMSERVSGSLLTTPVSRVFGAANKSRDNSLMVSGVSKSTSEASKSRVEKSFPTSIMSRMPLGHDVVAPSMPAVVSSGSVHGVDSGAVNDDGLFSSPKDDETRPEEWVQPTGTANNLQEAIEECSNTVAGRMPRASWTAGSGSMRVGWSGKAMTMTESMKFFEVLTSATEEHVAEQLLVALPNQFKNLRDEETGENQSEIATNVGAVAIGDHTDASLDTTA